MFDFNDDDFDYLYRLKGTTEAENIRHLVARIGFMNAFARDDRLAALFRSWRERLGFDENLPVLVSALDRLAGALGYSHRGYLHKDLIAGKASSVEWRNPTVSADVEVMERAGEACFSRLPGETKTFVEESTRFVRDELGLPWLWLVWEIHLLFVLQLNEEISGFDGRLTYQRTPRRPLAPSLHVTFETQEEETTVDALERLQSVFAETVAAIRKGTKALPPGRMPRGTRRRENGDLEIANTPLKRNGEWIYRARVRRETIAAIAADYYRAINPKDRWDPRDDTKTIRDGIADAERMLDLGPQFSSSG